ncbi:MAG TPA: penicillin acylase family protein [Gemmatimonadales bacterium]|jgi:penicillin amidase
MRLWAKVASVVAAVLLLGIAALLFSVCRSVAPLSGREQLPGLGSAVTVSFDTLAIPHIAAASDADAFMALGYLHARERLWSMDLLRRAAEGRLSEVLGSSTIESDRYLRSLDIVRSANAGLATMPPATRALLDAYVHGINAWIASPTRPLPPEFRILRYVPEPWIARQCFEIARIMAWDLQAGTTELRLARAEARIGPDRIRDLFPPNDSTGPTIIQPGTGTWKGTRRSRTAAREEGGAGEYARRQNAGDDFARRATLRSPPLLVSPSSYLAASEIPVVPELAERILDWAAMSRASNSWVIGGSRTASGKPILANDPHLDLRAPSLWYLAVIASPGFDVAGATIPGLPGVILGHNRRIAWGWTNLGADDVDYVIERFNADTSQVLTTGGWRPVQVVRDSIMVKGAAAVPFTMRRTAHGPIVGASPQPGTAASGEVRLLALRWNAHDPSDEASAVLMLDRAGTWDEFLAAARLLKAPEQSWIYADVDGNIGYTATGNVPVRRNGNGLLPTPGWTDEGHWDRYLDFDELPRTFNPPEGFIVTANNRVIGAEYPFAVTADWEVGYRAARIRELILTHAARLTTQDVQSMQMDTVDVFARWAKQLAAKAADSAGQADVGRQLRAWDATMGSDRTEPTVFWLWYRNLQRATLEDDLGGTYAPGNVFQSWLRAGASPWFDDLRTPAHEDLAALSLRAMRSAIIEAHGRRWGAIHTTVSDHALGSVAPLEMLLRLNIGPAPRAGSLYTVDVADFGARPPFVNTHAASFRQVVDLANPASAGMIITSGESGNPISRHYRDQMQPWWDGRLAPVTLGKDAGATGSVLILGN